MEGGCWAGFQAVTELYHCFNSSDFHSAELAVWLDSYTLGLYPDLVCSLLSTH